MVDKKLPYKIFVKILDIFLSFNRDVGLCIEFSISTRVIIVPIVRYKGQPHDNIFTFPMFNFPLNVMTPDWIKMYLQRNLKGMLRSDRRICYVVITWHGTWAPEVPRPLKTMRAKSICACKFDDVQYKYSIWLLEFHQITLCL